MSTWYINVIDQLISIIAALADSKPAVVSSTKLLTAEDLAQVLQYEYMRENHVLEDYAG